MNWIDATGASLKIGYNVAHVTKNQLTSGRVVYLDKGKHSEPPGRVTVVWDSKQVGPDQTYISYELPDRLIYRCMG
jgi:hypothetical protein